MAIIMRIAAFVFAGIIAVFLFPPPLIGEEMDFVPRIENVTGSLEFDMQRRDLKNTSGDRSIDTSFASSMEKMRLDAAGYVYHPRLMIFQMGGAAGLGQASSTSSMGRSSHGSHVFEEYDADATLLPEHPYNLELFTRRQKGAPVPLSIDDSVITSHGALFNYKQNPFSLHLSTVSTSFERADDWTDATSYAALAGFVIGPLANSAGHERTDTTTSQGMQLVSSSSNFTNAVILGPLSLKSSVESGRQTQNSPAQTSFIGTDTSKWSESLAATLPLNFSLGMFHDYRKEETTTEETPPSSPGADTFEKTTSDNVSITHMLYQSLRTSYSAGKSSAHSSGGDSDSSTQALAVGYSKKIPIGDLRAGYSVQDLVYTRTGAASIVNEVHGSAVPGVFALNNQAVNLSTITVMVRNPNPPQDLVTLTANIDYTVQQFGNTVQIAVLNVPINPPAASYVFVVSYSLAQDDSKIDIKTKAFNLGFTFFDGLFSPYFSYSTSDQEVISGTFPADHTITTIYGYTVQRSPFALRMEQTDYQSRIAPYRSLMASTDYRQFFEDDLDVTARIVYTRTERFTTDTSEGFLEKTTSIGASGHKAFPHENIDIFLSGTYSVVDFTGTTNKSYSLSPTVRWHVGKLDVYATASKSYSVSVGAFATQTSEEDAYFLSVSRKIF